MKRVLATATLLVLLCSTAQATGSATTAGETAAGIASEPMSNFSNVANTAKSDLGIKSQDYSGVFDGTAGAKGTLTASGNIQCVAGQQRYVGGVGIFINSCATSGTTVTSINVSVCNTVRDKGVPCTSADYTSSGTATPGTPLGLGADTLTFTCTGLDCGVSLSLQRSMSVTGPTISAQAAAAASAIGSSGLVNQLTTTIDGTTLEHDLSAEASTGTCYNNQIGSLNSTGNISNCAGTYTLSMYQPSTGTSSLCSGAGGGVAWEQSCIEDEPITVSDCHSSLECIHTQNTTPISCQTGTVQQVVIHSIACGPTETIASLVEPTWIFDWYGGSATQAAEIAAFYAGFPGAPTGPIMSYLWSISSPGGGSPWEAAYRDLNRPEMLYVDGIYDGTVQYLVYDGLFIPATATSLSRVYDSPLEFLNYVPALDYLSDIGATVPIQNDSGLTAWVLAGQSFQLCTPQCGSLSETETGSGRTYSCSYTGGMCPAGFYLNGQWCYQSAPIYGCAFAGTAPITVAGSSGAYIADYNCNTCGTYQALAP